MRKIERPVVEKADPNAISVKHGGRVSWRPSENNGKPVNLMVLISMNQPNKNSLSGVGAGYVFKGKCDDPARSSFGPKGYLSIREIRNDKYG